jgi:transcriptional regulator with XRE-family HTH domain
MNIHQRIKERRLALDLKSHGALAELVGVSWQTVQLWEKEGGTAPKRTRLDKVAKVLGVSTAWLLNGPDNFPEKSADSAATSLPSNTSPPGLQWVTYDEYQILTMYRATDATGRQSILDVAETVKKSLIFSTIRHKS